MRRFGSFVLAVFLVFLVTTAQANPFHDDAMNRAKENRFLIGGVTIGCVLAALTGIGLPVALGCLIGGPIGFAGDKTFAYESERDVK